jgi:hypothetical protein
MIDVEIFTLNNLSLYIVIFDSPDSCPNSFFGSLLLRSDGVAKWSRLSIIKKIKRMGSVVESEVSMYNLNYRKILN